MTNEHRLSLREAGLSVLTLRGHPQIRWLKSKAPTSRKGREKWGTLNRYDVVCFQLTVKVALPTAAVPGYVTLMV